MGNCFAYKTNQRRNIIYASPVGVVKAKPRNFLVNMVSDGQIT